MLAVSLNDRVVYHPSEMEKVWNDDQEKWTEVPKEDATAFSIRALSAEELAHLTDSGLSVRGAGDIRMLTGSATLLAVRMAVTDVRGLRDPDSDNAPLRYETEKPSKQFGLPPFWKNDREVISRRFLRRIPQSVLIWLANEITEENQLSEEDLGNSSEGAIDDGTLTFERPALSAGDQKAKA